MNRVLFITVDLVEEYSLELKLQVAESDAADLILEDNCIKSTQSTTTRLFCWRNFSA